MADKAELQERIETMIDFVVEAEQKAQNDEIADLKTLDGDITDLCNDVTSAEPETAKELQPVMATLISRLDDLATGLKECKKRQEEKS